MSTATKITPRESEILDQAQAALAAAARKLLPADKAAEFEAHMVADRAAKFDEQTDEEYVDQLHRAKATHAYLAAMGTPQELLDGFRAGDYIASVSVELTPA